LLFNKQLVSGTSTRASYYLSFLSFNYTVVFCRSYLWSWLGYFKWI